MQIHSEPGSTPKEEITVRVDDPDLDFATASGLAKEKARAVNPDAMLLAWHNGKSGEFYPKYECGPGDKAPWIVFAEARGGNLVININGGAYTFIYLKL